METKSSIYLSLFPLWFLCFTIITLVSSSSSTWYDDHISLRENRNEENFSFPRNFLFGTASSSSYQYEGAYLTDGKTLSNWDVFTSIPGKFSDRSHGKVAVDHYHRYPEDLDLMEDLGVNIYRLSLSWARILPKGRFGYVNMAGIDHYNRMINNILKRGIEPFVTLTHYDIPQELEFRYGSWLNPQIRENGNEENFSFPTNFLFGTASSSYQYEGAYLTDGKTLSNWDVFTSIPGKFSDGSHGKVAVDHYHRYPEDLDLMEDLGVNSYRLSLSWARILPKGRFGYVNMAGIDHYNRMINNILKRGIEPFVTLTHYDIPQELEFRYGSWLNPQIQEDFEHYADICFQYFGNRVKFWSTFNEPNVQVILSYRNGTYPPSRCSKAFGNCARGDSDLEPLVAAHNIIRSHLAAVNLYRTKYQEEQRGKIGIVMNTIWYEPVSDSLADILAVERAQAFYLTWFLDPIVFGRYPREMRKIIGEDLPEFTKDDLKSSKSGLDFIGINQYTSRYAKDCVHSACKPGKGGSRAEGFVYSNARKDGLPLGEPTGVDWFNIYPQGMEKMLMYATERYKIIPLYVTENGFGENNTGVLLNDYRRVKFLSNYLDALKRAMRNGAGVRGYFTWSLLDNFELISGYTIRFGLYHVDFDTQERTPRLSASWYKNFIFQHRAQSKDYDDA